MKYFLNILLYILLIGLIYSDGCNNLNNSICSAKFDCQWNSATTQCYTVGPDMIILSPTVVISGKYSLSSFLSPDFNLWQVMVTNNYQGDANLDLRLEIKMEKDNDVVLWGVTKPILLNSTEYISPLTNMDFEGSDLSWFEQDDQFENLVASSGVLPQGLYRLTINAYSLGLYERQYADNHNDKIDKSGLQEISGDEVVLLFASTEEELIEMYNLNIPEQINLFNPGNLESIYDPNPWFRWESPGFGTSENPITVEYRLIVALFDPAFHTSLIDALEDETNVYYNSGWWNPPENETGTPQQISMQYPSNERDLSCGYQYCWRVEARETGIFSQDDYGQTTPSLQGLAGNEGIWGWPEPAISNEIYSFYYGTTLTESEISSPSSYINTVSPVFSFNGVLCADSYEIWLSDIDDPEVTNPIWKSEFFQNTSYQYPTSANGLSPGEKYFWKIRVNPESNPSPWSPIFDFTVNDISFSSPMNGEIVNTLFPTFNISSPTNVSEYQLLISNEEDPEVVQYNILSENFGFFPFDFPLNNSIMFSPGKIYYWKVQTIDDNGNLTKLISDNTNISAFSIKPIDLSFPDNQSYNTSLTPLFSWSGPIGLNSYIIEFTTEEYPDFSNIIFSSNVNSSFFLSSNISANLPFDYGTTYLWRVKPIDNNGEEGPPSEIFSFSTILNNSDLTTLSTETDYEQVEFDISFSGSDGKDINVTIITEIENADTYLIQLSKNADMSDIVEEAHLSSNILNHFFSGLTLDWNTDYYIQITAFSNDEIIGQPSNVNMIVMPFEPGSQEQAEFDISLIENIIPSLNIEIINSVDNATNYIFRLSINNDMSNPLFSETIGTEQQYIYQNSDEILDFGEIYYVQLIPLKNGQIHGLASAINNIFIPNIIAPKLSDTQFYWEHSIPQSPSYILEISTTEDFAVILYNDISESDNMDINDIFEDGTPYYWRVRGRDDPGAPFGDYSTPKYFISSGEMAEIEDTENTEITIILQSPDNNSIISTKNPTFIWEAIDGAEKYEIIVSGNDDLTNSVWNSQNIFNNSTVYPTSGAEPLEYNILYYWSVRAITNNMAISSFNSPFIFTVSSNLIPDTISPKGIAEIINPYFSWSRVQNANSYNLILSDNNDYSNVIYRASNIADNFFEYPNDAPTLSYNKEYFWKVVAISENNSQLGDYSTSTSFITPSGIIKLEFIFGNNND